jgi:hypothetical protein
MASINCRGEKAISCTVTVVEGCGLMSVLVGVALGAGKKHQNKA